MNIQTPKIWLPRTGQTTSYANGDDGYYQAGNPRTTRFIDNLNGTISDRATGLQWVKQPELIIPGAVGVHPTNQIQVAHGSWANNHAYALADLCKDVPGSTYWVCVTAHTSAAAGTFAADRAGAAAGKWRQTVWTASASSLEYLASMTWANAVANSLALEYAGFSDWRLPNLMEFLSVMNLGTDVSPMTYPGGLVMLEGQYWTSTTYILATDSAWSIDNTSVGISRDDKTYAYYLVPVRGGRINANW